MLHHSQISTLRHLSSALITPIVYYTCAEVAELADARGLGPRGLLAYGGSTPLLGIFGVETRSRIAEFHNGGIIRGQSGRDFQFAAFGHGVEGVFNQIAEYLEKIAGPYWGHIRGIAC